ncbi:MAG: hypothetical protein RDV48_03365 [Candidatus Eremiobacteraeota bacterium]|nr:hypothetical protein [Candidatus Eremiobacteraeota bacterium]
MSREETGQGGQDTGRPKVGADLSQADSWIEEHFKPKEDGTFKASEVSEDDLLKARTKRKRFDGGITSELKTIFFLFLTAALALIAAGLYFILVEKKVNISICVFIGALVLLVLPVLYGLSNRNNFVVVTPECLMVGRGEAVSSIVWSDITSVRESGAKRRTFRSVTLEDRTGRKINISSVVFPKYDLFLGLLRMAKRFYEEGGKKGKKKQERD